MFQEKNVILENREVAPAHWLLRLGSKRIGAAARPGRFVQVLASGSTDPLLPRPFSFLTAGKTEFSLLYQVVGKGTLALSRMKKGDSLKVLGPLGNGFLSHTAPGKGLVYVLVGGGVGIPPLYHLAEELVKKNKVPAKNVRVFLGARRKELLLCENDFKKLGVAMDNATDDGSRGTKGFVTQPLSAFLGKADLKSTRVFTCGPTPMLKAVSKICLEKKVSCEVSVEEPMACGFGACLGCAIKVKDGGGHRFAVACSEGPVFPAACIAWE